MRFATFKWILVQFIVHSFIFYTDAFIPLGFPPPKTFNFLMASLLLKQTPFNKSVQWFQNPGGSAFKFGNTWWYSTYLDPDTHGKTLKGSQRRHIVLPEHRIISLLPFTLKVSNKTININFELPDGCGFRSQAKVISTFHHNIWDVLPQRVHKFYA